MLTNPIINHILNIWLAYGIRASGRLRTDRYNLRRNKAWTEDNIKSIISEFENASGLKTATYSINAQKNRQAHNNIVRDTVNSTFGYIPLRFKKEA